MYTYSSGSVNYYNRFCLPTGEWQDKNWPDRLFNKKPKDRQQFLNYRQGEFTPNIQQKFNKGRAVHPYDYALSKTPNLLLLTPAIFGSAAAFILGFRFFGHDLTTGYKRYIYFLNIYTFLASLGVGLYIYESRVDKTSLYAVFFPALLLMFYFGSVFNLTYSLYPDTFAGSIDASNPISQFVVFLALGIANVSVGGTVDVVPKKPGVKILFSITGLFTLFIFSVIVSLGT
jgi:hypothetical protein